MSLSVTCVTKFGPGKMWEGDTNRAPAARFVSMPHGLPVGKTIEMLLDSSEAVHQASDLAAWCLDQIISDQFTEGDAAGAWSQHYPSYMQFIYGSAGTPTDLSAIESISVTRIIGSALARYMLGYSTWDFSSLISPRLLLSKDYLIRHYSPNVGGFGLSTRMQNVAQPA